MSKEARGPLVDTPDRLEVDSELTLVRSTPELLSQNYAQYIRNETEWKKIGAGPYTSPDDMAAEYVRLAEATQEGHVAGYSILYRPGPGAKPVPRDIYSLLSIPDKNALLAGSGGVYEIDGRTAGVGYRVDRDLRKRKIATQTARALVGLAFDSGFDLVQLEIGSDNRASQRVAAGQYAQNTGQIVINKKTKQEEVVWVLSKEDWEKARGVGEG